MEEIKINKYNNAKIYKLVTDVDDTFYIGSTCSTLAKRFYGHKKDSKLQPKCKVYQHFNNIGFEHVKIVLIDELNLQNNDQLRREEDKHIRMYKDTPNCLNFQVAYRTNEYIIQYNKDWRSANKEMLRVKQQKYRAAHPGLETLKKAKYRAKNAEKLNEKTTCICGSIIRKSEVARHVKSKKHQKYCSNSEQP